VTTALIPQSNHKQNFSTILYIKLERYKVIRVRTRGQSILYCDFNNNNNNNFSSLS